MMIPVTRLTTDQADCLFYARRIRRGMTERPGNWPSRPYMAAVDVSATDTSACARRARSPYDDGRTIASGETVTITHPTHVDHLQP